MKCRQYPRLQAGLKINQQVAATDEVHARERRVAQEILSGEDDGLPQGLTDAVAAVLLDKEPSQAFGRHVLHQALGVKAGAGFIQQRRVEVGGENLKLARV